MVTMSEEVSDKYGDCSIPSVSGPLYTNTLALSRALQLVIIPKLHLSQLLYSSHCHAHGSFITSVILLMPSPA